MTERKRFNKYTDMKDLPLLKVISANVLCEECDFIDHLVDARVIISRSGFIREAITEKIKHFIQFEEDKLQLAKRNNLPVPTTMDRLKFYYPETYEKIMKLNGENNGNCMV